MWCHITDVFLTAEGREIDNYKLMSLVEQFNLGYGLSVKS
jgi:hypothetical protein